MVLPPENAALNMRLFARHNFRVKLCTYILFGFERNKSHTHSDRNNAEESPDYSVETAKTPCLSAVGVSCWYHQSPL